MQSFHAHDQHELERLLAPFAEGFLFRGQTREYNHEDGSPNLTSSFQRKGCVPPLMLKWIFYTQELLRRSGLDIHRPDLLGLTQGLLQHYGWRSFYVDLSSNATIAAWFASHAFKANPLLELCENVSEEAVLLRRLNASYIEHTETGHLYVLSKERLKDAGHSLISLEDELAADCPSRFETQSAWLAGIFDAKTRIEPAAIVAHITAPAAIFAELALTGGYKETGDVFPGPETDVLLANLLHLPWDRIDVPNPVFAAYMRSLEIPEYQVKYIKHLPGTMALYTPFWLSDVQPPEPNEIWLHVDESMFYGHSDPDRPFPRLAEYLRQNQIVNIESKQLICYPSFPNNVNYQKGISIRRKEKNIFEVCGISVDYVSDKLSGSGISDGYSYELIDNSFVRHPLPTDCSCGDPERHAYHIRALAVLDDMLSSATVRRRDQIIEVSI